MNTIALGSNYSPFLDSGGARARRIALDFSDGFQGFADISLVNDLSALHAVVLKPDVGIISTIQQQPRLSANENAIVVDVARILSNKRLIASFAGSGDSIEEFSSYYNGRRLRRLVRSLTGATISRAEIEDLLGSILEDALIATSSHLMADGSNIVSLNDEEEFILELAIAERLPRIYEESANAFAAKLMQDLKVRLGVESALAIDDGAVYFGDGRLHIVDVGKNPVNFDAANRRT